MTSSVPLSGVEQTAIDAAWLRAIESRRADRLFHDPYAEVFADAAPGVLPREMPDEHAALLEMARLQVVVRTRFFDDYLLCACADGLRQVVLLGAGLDARGFRLAWPDGVRLFELDLPEVLSLKNSVQAGEAMAPRCERVVVPVDLRTDWCTALIMAGFDTAAPTVWLAEGLFVYLSTDEVTRLVGVVSRLSAPGSRMSFEYGIADGAPAADRPASPLDQVAALRKGGPYVYVNASGRLARQGWQIRTHDAAGFAASCGLAVEGHAIGGFLTAKRDTAPTDSLADGVETVDGECEHQFDETARVGEWHTYSTSRSWLSTTRPGGSPPMSGEGRTTRSMRC